MSTTTRRGAVKRSSGKGAIQLLVSAGFLALAYWFLRAQLAQIDPRDVWVTMRGTSLQSFGVAILATFASYCVLSQYDRLALRAVNVKLAYAKVFLSSFVAYTFNFNLGSLVGAVGLRFYMYSLWGVRAAPIAAVTILTAIISWSGYAFVAGVVWVWVQLPIPGIAGQEYDGPIASTLPIGLMILLLLGLYLVLCLFMRRPLKVRGLVLQLPTLSKALTYIGVAMWQWLLPSLVLYILMPASVEVSFLDLWAVHLVAAIAGAMVHIPGGLGVLEGTFLLMLKSYGPAESILAGILAFRIVYYVVPLLLGSLCLAGGALFRTKTAQKGANQRASSVQTQA